jgi:hypothetical protein
MSSKRNEDCEENFNFADRRLSTDFHNVTISEKQTDHTRATTTTAATSLQMTIALIRIAAAVQTQTPSRKAIASPNSP